MKNWRRLHGVRGGIKIENQENLGQCPNIYTDRLEYNQYDEDALHYI